MILSTAMVVAFVLAQVDPVAATGAVAKDPLAYLLLASLGALGYMYRDHREQVKDLRKEISDLHVKLAEMIRSDAKEQRETLQATIPLTLKLSEALGILEQVTRALLAKED